SGPPLADLAAHAGRDFLAINLVVRWFEHSPPLRHCEPREGVLMVGAWARRCKGQSTASSAQRPRLPGTLLSLPGASEKEVAYLLEGVRPEYEPCRGTSQALQISISSGRLSTSALRNFTIRSPFQIASADSSSRLPRICSLRRSRQHPTTRPAKSIVKLTH